MGPVKSAIAVFFGMLAASALVAISGAVGAFLGNLINHHFAEPSTMVFALAMVAAIAIFISKKFD